MHIMAGLWRLKNHRVLVFIAKEHFIGLMYAVYNGLISVQLFNDLFWT